MSSERALRLLVTVTLNPNQLKAHLDPIIDLPEIESITLVADRPGPNLPKLTTRVPSKWLVRALGRSGAKLVCCLAIAWRERPDWVIGLNLVPHGVNALLVGRLTGSRVLYHEIGGPVEWEGGGWQSDNRILGRLQRPSRVLERILLHAIRACTTVAVMGEFDRRALIGRGLCEDRVVVVPASVDEERFHPAPSNAQHHDYHLVTVSSLIPRKRVHDFIQAVARLRYDDPSVRAAVVGEGPLESALLDQVSMLGLEGSIDFLGFRQNIEDVYRRSQVFVLTSRREGLSIALSEAMASGLPPVVSDVGEARTLVRDGSSGYLFQVGDVDTLVDRVNRLLSDPGLRKSLGDEAARVSLAVTGRRRISTIYRHIFSARLA